MEKFTLANGTKIDAIGFGTYKVSDALTDGRTKEIIRDALLTGYRYIDTAAFYGNEGEIGEVIRELQIPREEIFLQTKVWKTELGYEKTAQAIRDSLKRLQMDYIDLLMIHWPKEFPGDPDWKEKVQGSYKAMEDAQKAGLVRNLGLSNFLPHHIMAIMEIASEKPLIDQLELHVGHMQYAAVVYCKEHDILPQAWSPLGRTRIFKHPVLMEMAERYGVTVADLTLRFLLQQGISVIPKANSKAHMETNMNPAEFTISEEDMSVLLTMPSIGWAGEHPDFEREAVDFRYQL